MIDQVNPAPHLDNQDPALFGQTAMDMPYWTLT